MPNRRMGDRRRGAGWFLIGLTRRLWNLSALIHDRQFLLYCGIGGIVYVLNVALLYVFIDMWGISTVVSSSIVIGGLFVLKYVMYRATGFSK